MSTSPSSTPPPAAARVPLRVSVARESSSSGTDGAWWPQSRDLAVEAADLVDNLTGTGYVNRLLFSRPDWDDAVADGRGRRRIQARRGPVKVGSFPRDDTRLMVLVLSNGSRIRLEVIPSDTSPDDAERRLGAFGPGTTSGGAEAPAE